GVRRVAPADPPALGPRRRPAVLRGERTQGAAYRRAAPRAGEWRRRGERARRPDVTALLPGWPAPAVRSLVVRDDGSRGAGGRGLLGACPRDPPQGRTHLRLSREPRGRDDRLPARPQPDGARPGRGRTRRVSPRGAGAGTRSRSAGARRPAASGGATG